ncbi:MAG: Lrp/AsnC ligand binding domain-containing protein [Candidatus Nitrosopolaris sp.]
MPSAYLLINCKLGSDKEVIDRLKEIPVVIQVYRVYGAYDIIVRVAAGTVEKLQQALKSDLKRLDNIVSTVTLVTKEI